MPREVQLYLLLNFNIILSYDWLKTWKDACLGTFSGPCPKRVPWSFLERMWYMSLTKGRQGDKRQAGLFLFWENPCHSYFTSYREKSLGEEASPVTHSINKFRIRYIWVFSKLENIYCELFSLPMEEEIFQIISSYLFNPASVNVKHSSECVVICNGTSTWKKHR